MKTLLVTMIALAAVAVGAILVIELIKLWENETNNKR